MITNITLENFKCFRKLVVEPRLITMFIGPNGSGKSIIRDLLSSENLIQCGVDSWAAAMHFQRVAGSYSTAYRCILGELIQCDWLPKEIKTAIQQRYQDHLDGVESRRKEDIELIQECRPAERESLVAWREAGGLG